MFSQVSLNPYTQVQMLLLFFFHEHVSDIKAAAKH